MNCHEKLIIRRPKLYWNRVLWTSLNFFHPMAASVTDTFNWHTRSPTQTRPGSIYNSWRDLVAPLREERGEFTPWPNYTLLPFAPSALRSSQKAECMTLAHSKVLSAFRADGLFLKTNFPCSLSHTHAHLLSNTTTHTLAGSTYILLWPSGTLDSGGKTVEELWAPPSGSESFSALLDSHSLNFWISVQTFPVWPPQSTESYLLVIKGVFHPKFHPFTTHCFLHSGRGDIF